MIIANGHVTFLVAAEDSSIGADGYMSSAARTQGTPIPCQFYASSQSLVAKSNGEPVIRASYVILLEHYGHTLSKPERLKLTDRHGNEVGEFSVIRFEPLDAVCQVRITV